MLYLTKALWLPQLGAFLVVTDPLPAAPVQRVLPLAGDLERVFYAAALTRADRAQKILITTLPLTSSTARATHLGRVRAIIKAMGASARQTALVPGYAATTFAELQNARVYLERMRVHSLLVVTSPWHTRRARLNLQAAFRGSDIRVAVAPVQPQLLPFELRHQVFDQQTWWRNPHTRKAVLGEYVKLALFRFGIR